MSDVNKYTKEFIKDKLATDDRWLRRGVIRIAELQTNSEIRSESTLVSNGVGFNSSDAKFLTMISKIISRKPNSELREILSSSQLYLTRKRMIKYAGQLTKIANNKEVR